MQIRRKHILYVV